MKETSFIQQNKDKWQEFEKLASSGASDPEELSRYFVELTDDLSYSRTFYPNRSVRLYLNGMARKAFQSIYKNRRQEFGKKLKSFLKDELPFALWEARKDLWLAAAIFILTVIIGCVSTKYDSSFPKYILGEDYIKMTERNIAQGNPMGVYKQGNTLEMFFTIGFNNLRVDFLMFALGALFSIGTVAITLYNGIMLGTFQYYFFQKGLLLTTALTIWLHGTLEMGAMVIVAGAGMTMGRGLLFPGNYKRVYAFQLSAMRGVKLFLAALPLTFVAAIIETWVTRHTDAPVIFKLLLILASLSLVVGLFYILPWYKNKKGHFVGMKEKFRLAAENLSVPAPKQFNNNDVIFRDVFWMFRSNFPWMLKWLTGAALIMTGLTSYFAGQPDRISSGEMMGFIFSVMGPDASDALLVSAGVWLSLVFGAAHYITYQFCTRHRPRIHTLLRMVLTSVICGFGFVFQFHQGIGSGFFLLLFVFPFLMMFATTLFYHEGRWLGSFGEAFKLSFSDIWKFAGMFLMIYLVGTFIYIISSGALVMMFVSFFTDQIPVDKDVLNWVTGLSMVFLFSVLLGAILFLLVYACTFLYFSLVELESAEQLKQRIRQIGVRKK